MNMGDCLAWARKRHPILERPNDKSGMTLKPYASAQLQRDLKIRNILDTAKNSSTSCVFIIRLLKQFGEPGGRSTGVVNCHYSQNLCNPLYINKLPPRKSRIYFNLHRSISSSAIAVYIHLPSQYIFIRHRSIYSSAIAVYIHSPSQYIFQSRGNELPAGNALLNLKR